MQEYLDTKASVNYITEEFLRFVSICLNDEAFEVAVMALLPFDNSVQARLKNAYDNSLVKSMGVAMMRMEVEPQTFSLGVGIELEEGVYNEAVNAMTFVLAGKTIEETRTFVKTDSFSKLVKESFDKQVDISFSIKNKDVWR